MAKPVILWFRRNLRLSDNAALIAAARSGSPVIPLYIVDEQDVGRASRWWLQHSLANLDSELQNRGGSLVIRSGPPRRVLTEISAQTGARALYCTRRYEPVSRRQEDELCKTLATRMTIHLFDDSLLHDPDSVMSRKGTPYRAFTHFWKAAAGRGDPPPPQPVPASIRFADEATAPPFSADANVLRLPTDLSPGLAITWTPGESAGLSCVAQLESILPRYADYRDRPDMDGTSRLSPHLRFGEISIRQVWHAVRQMEVPQQSTKGVEALLRQLFWREFSTYLLYHFPDLPSRPLRREFEVFPWSDDELKLHAWQRGMTGYPIVDAGMRQLRRTGWMHNRVRMIAASFLVKDLLIPWQTGAAWFLDALVDADLANNSANWQWVAGCGADAAPYFRILNPILQRQKFDPHGHYVRQWVPELNTMSETDYYSPIIDHSAARRRALEAYQIVKGTRTSKLAP